MAHLFVFPPPPPHYTFAHILTRIITPLRLRLHVRVQGRSHKVLLSPVSGDELAHTRLLSNRGLQYIITHGKYDRLGPQPINVNMLPEAW